MKCFSCAFLFLISINSYALDYKLSPGGDDIDGVMYSTLAVSDENTTRYIDIALEGNSSQAVLREHFPMSCPWGTASVVRISMDSSTVDGGGSIDNYYAFDKRAENIFAKSYFFTKSDQRKEPLSLRKSVCLKKEAGVKKSLRTGKNYIEESEVIEQGPFSLKGTTDIDIKFVLKKDLAIVKESRDGEEIIAHYEDVKGVSAIVSTVFFMKLEGKNNFVSLISWGKDTESGCYKVFAYSYTNEGRIAENLFVNHDPSLSGCSRKGEKFSYTNASEIKKYLTGKYTSKK